MKTQAIETGRLTPRGGIQRQHDLEWEGYLQVHDQAERLGLLSYDEELHDFLDARLAVFEERYEVAVEPTT